MIDPNFDPYAILQGHEHRLNLIDRLLREQNMLIENLAQQNTDLVDLIIANQQQIKLLKKELSQKND